ncbi:AmmeMemoRadiSam system protein A [Desulfobacter latus]|uniref:AmmeMemoRadiSam system protein A n=1 Tax=Desulfobacter latus TaxID=2292 RepID=A0A850T6P2_9BACT|nr:AmmeMemoRadiSam system protein A [Desulfobacter latus]NWH03897.1 AmmeMemoRadiSam system protein A [Desulfobacter latus]
MISDKQGQILLQMARAGIAEELGIPVDSTQVDLNQPFLQAKQGLFVTLHKNGALRGCIGVIEPVESLKTGVGKTAKLAAFKDSRFAPLGGDEFDQVDLEISLLSLPEKFEYSTAKELVQGLVPFKDGVIIKKGSKQAVFLPQVWEQLPDAASFLSHLCIKAGLDADEWTKGDLIVHTYRVHSFCETR